MASLKEVFSKIKPQVKKFPIGGQDLDFAPLDMGDFKKLHELHQINFFSGAQDVKLTPESVCTMIECSLKKTYTEVTNDLVSQIVTTRLMNSPEFIGILAHLQGAREEEVERQVERLKAEQENRLREAQEEDKKALKK